MKFKKGDAVILHDPNGAPRKATVASVGPKWVTLAGHKGKFTHDGRGDFSASIETIEDFERWKRLEELRGLLELTVKDLRSMRQKDCELNGIADAVMALRAAVVDATREKS